MTNVAKEIGAKIKFFRKKNNITIQEMANAICKSKATISKYENGQISIDIITLYEIAKFLQVHVEQLLYLDTSSVPQNISENIPAFFINLPQFYIYYYDGRNNSLNRCVVDVLSQEKQDTYKIIMYMNIDNYEHYHNCENTYIGNLCHYDAVSNLILKNQDTPMEQITISILAPYLNASEKWALFFGISSRPIMPVSTKVLVSKKIQKENAQLIQKLHISKEDIKIMKLYNMLTII